MMIFIVNKKKNDVSKLNNHSLHVTVNGHGKLPTDFVRNCTKLDKKIISAFVINKERWQKHNDLAVLRAQMNKRNTKIMRLISQFQKL